MRICDVVNCKKRGKLFGELFGIKFYYCKFHHKKFILFFQRMRNKKRLLELKHYKKFNDIKNKPLFSF